MKLITNQSSVKITLCGPQTSHGRTGFSACYSGMCFQILIGFLGEYIRWNSHWPCLAFFAGTLVVAAIVESVDGFRTRQNFESILRLVCFVILCAKGIIKIITVACFPPVVRNPIRYSQRRRALIWSILGNFDQVWICSSLCMLVGDENGTRKHAPFATILVIRWRDHLFIRCSIFEKHVKKLQK